MCCLRALTLPAVCGLLAIAVPATDLVAAEGRRHHPTPVVTVEPEVEGETIVSEECEAERACQVIEPCGAIPMGMLWCEADYLLWWTKGMEIPPLVTAGTTGVLGCRARRSCTETKRSWMVSGPGSELD